MTNYQIIATLGPASEKAETWQGMLKAGATGFRLNTSHLSLEQLEGWIERLSRVLSNREVPIVLDLQGSKWRLRQFEAREVAAGERVTLVLARCAQYVKDIPVPHTDFFVATAQSDGAVVLNDAKVRLQVERIEGGRVLAQVEQAGPLSSNKGITLRDSTYRSERLNEKDLSIYRMTNGLAGVRYAVSYVRDGLEMQRYRELLGMRPDLIAKLERAPALADISGIQAQAGELWLCRGDLGAEVGLAKMAEEVYAFSQHLKKVRVPVLMAGQVLEHMVGSPVPTRSEVCYLYDVFKAGYAGVVLSDETALGKYPVEACCITAQFK